MAKSITSRNVRKRMDNAAYQDFLRYRELSRIVTQAQKEQRELKERFEKEFKGRDALLSPDGSQRVVRKEVLVPSYTVAESVRVSYAIEEVRV